MKRSISEKLRFQLDESRASERSHIYNANRYGKNALNAQEHYILRDKLLSLPNVTYAE